METRAEHQTLVDLCTPWVTCTSASQRTAEKINPVLLHAIRQHRPSHYIYARVQNQSTAILSAATYAELAKAEFAQHSVVNINQIQMNGDYCRITVKNGQQIQSNKTVHHTINIFETTNRAAYLANLAMIDKTVVGTYISADLAAIQQYVDQCLQISSNKNPITLLIDPIVATVVYDIIPEYAYQIVHQQHRRVTCAAYAFEYAYARLCASNQHMGYARQPHDFSHTRGSRASHQQLFIDTKFLAYHAWRGIANASYTEHERRLVRLALDDVLRAADHMLLPWATAERKRLKTSRAQRVRAFAIESAPLEQQQQLLYKIATLVYVILALMIEKLDDEPDTLTNDAASMAGNGAMPDAQDAEEQSGDGDRQHPRQAMQRLMDELAKAAQQQQPPETHEHTQIDELWKQLSNAVEKAAIQRATRAPAHDISDVVQYVTGRVSPHVIKTVNTFRNNAQTYVFYPNTYDAQHEEVGDKKQAGSATVISAHTRLSDLVNEVISAEIQHHNHLVQSSRNGQQKGSKGSGAEIVKRELQTIGVLDTVAGCNILKHTTRAVIIPYNRLLSWLNGNTPLANHASEYKTSIVQHIKKLQELRHMCQYGNSGRTPELLQTLTALHALFVQCLDQCTHTQTPAAFAQLFTLLHGAHYKAMTGDKNTMRPSYNGTIDIRKLARYSWELETYPFKTRTEHWYPKLRFTICLDTSGSMADSIVENYALAYHLVKTLRRVPGVKARICSFTAWVLREDEPITYARALAADGGTPLHVALEGVYHDVRRSPMLARGGHDVVIVISDGQPDRLQQTQDYAKMVQQWAYMFGIYFYKYGAYGAGCMAASLKAEKLSYSRQLSNALNNAPVKTISRFEELPPAIFDIVQALLYVITPKTST